MADAQTEMILALRTEFDAARKDVRGMKDELGGLSKQSKNTGDSFTSGLMPSISKAGLAAGAAALAFKGLQYSVGLAIQKQTKLAEFSAITGVTGEKLEAFGDAADQLAIKFGGSALDNVESFKGVLSRLGPDFASSQSAVAMMGDSINTLAVASGLEAPAAMDALTTAMLQFGVDLKDPVAAAKDAQYMMNVMAAAAKEGAMEIPQLSEALVQTGSVASSLGVSFEETNAALETLATGGKYGSEAGIALRNVMTSLVKVSELAKDELSAYGLNAEELGTILTTKGVNAAMLRLKQATEEHGTASQDAALMTALFGKENIAAAGTLIKNTQLTDKLTEAIGGTTTANEQAAVMMQTVSKRWDVVAAKVDVYAEKIGKLLMPVIEGVMSVIDEFIAKIEATGDGFGKLFEGDFAGAWDSFTGSAKKAKTATEEVATSMRKAAPNVEAVTSAMEKTEKKTKKATKEVKTLADIIKDKYDAGEQAILMRRLFGEPSAKSAASALQDVSNKLTATQRPVSEMIDGIQEVNVAPPDWAAIFAADELEEIQKMVDSDVFKLAATAASEAAAMIGGAIGGADMSWKDMLRSILGSMMSFVQVEFLAAKAAAAIRALFTSGVSLTTDLALSALAYGALEVAKGAVNSFRSGIQYVPYDQMAMLHQGEQVKTKEEVQSERRGRSKTTQVHFSKFRAPMDDYYITRGRDVR